MEVADGYGQGIGGILGREGLQPEQQFHHVLHLPFFSLAIPSHRLLDLAGSVFVDREITVLSGDDRRSAGVAELEGGPGVAVDEDILDRSHFRPVYRDDLAKIAKDNQKSSGEILFAGGADGPAGNHAHRRAPGIDHAVASHPRARINAENAHPVRSKPPSGNLLHEVVSNIEIGMHLLDIIVILKVFQETQ